MALFNFQTITATQAMNFAAGDSLAFGGGDASQVNVVFSSAPEQVAITLAGQTVTFGTGIYNHLDLKFDNGGMVLVGGTGADNATGSAADDALFGGQGGDTLNGGDGSNLIQGNQGEDSLTGGAGNDTIYGGQDNDVIVVGVGSAEVNWGMGNRGDDTITASNGTDVLLGGQGDDRLMGGSGGDYLDGNLGNDTIQGGTGGDTIIGEGGYDVLSGGGGADLFIFDGGSSDNSVALADRILDWSSVDHIQLPVKGGYTELTAAGGVVGDPYGYGITPATSDAFTTAQGDANSALAGDATLQIVSVQSGSDVVVFVDTNADHMADMAIILVGAGLTAIDASNFV